MGTLSAEIIAALLGAFNKYGPVIAGKAVALIQKPDATLQDWANFFQAAEGVVNADGTITLGTKVPAATAP